MRPMGSKTWPGIFVGYHQQVGGQWSGDIYAVPLVYIERNNQNKPHCRRIPVGNITVAKKKGHERDPEDGFIFPVRRIQENYGEEIRPVSSDSSSSSSSSSSDGESSSSCSQRVLRLSQQRQSQMLMPGESLWQRMRELITGSFRRTGLPGCIRPLDMTCLTPEALRFRCP